MDRHLSTGGSLQARGGRPRASATVWSQGGSIDTVVWALQQQAGTGNQDSTAFDVIEVLDLSQKAYIGLNVEMLREQWISISGCKIVFGASPAC